MDRIDRERAEACMLGVAIGDSLGLAYEGLPRQRGTKLYPFPLRQRLFLGTGFLSDDTLQSALVLNALGQSLDPKEFQRALAFNLRSWFLCLPPGIGMATIRACLKLTVGVSPTKSGVNSGGNGAAMRSAVIGAALHSAVEARIALAETSARITHTHPLAIQGAQLVSLAAALSAQGNEHLFEQQARALVPDWPWQTPWPETGPTGYVVHTVNAVAQILKSCDSFQEAIEKAVSLGGDTDTVGAIVGGIFGAKPDAVIPKEWLRYRGWPQPVDLGNPQVPWAKVLGGHATSLPVILAHGFRRLMPPY